MDAKNKKNIFLQNKKLFEYAFVKYIRYNRPMKYVYNNFLEERMKNQQFDKYAIVDVIMSDALSIAKQFVEKGMRPAILTTIDQEFDGMRVELGEKIYDDTLLLRTNYYRTLHSSDIFPINLGDTVYTQYLFAIGDQNFNTMNNGFYFSAITTAVTKQNELFDNNLPSETFLSTILKIKTVFQLACLNNHDVLILPIFGHENNYPIENILSIYNNCILEYGHLFKFIVISVSNHPTMQEPFLIFLNGIVKPHTYLLQNITQVPDQTPQQQLSPEQELARQKQLFYQQQPSHQQIPNQLPQQQIPNQLPQQQIPNQLPQQQISNQLPQQQIPNYANRQLTH